MYKSPIDLIYHHVLTEQENEVFKAVIRCAVDVDKDELIKALAYDRRQYDLGYADGKMDANAELIRCKDCKYYNPQQHYCAGIGNWFGYDDEWSDNGYCYKAEPKEKER